MALECLSSVILNNESVELLTLTQAGLNAINTNISQNEANRYNEQNMSNASSYIQQYGYCFLDMSVRPLPSFDEKEWVIGGNTTTLQLFCPKTRDDDNSMTCIVVYRDTPSLNNVINRLMESKTSTRNRKFYFGVALDSVEHTGYLIFCDGTGSIKIGGGIYNNKNIVYEAFKQYLVLPITSNGGGATHIAKVTGQLSSLSSNLSDILMVSGGGGGGLIIGEDAYTGKDAGGISGSGNNSANQTTGYAFGQGESGEGVSGGGGGLYGGYKGGTS